MIELKNAYEETHMSIQNLVEKRFVLIPEFIFQVENFIPHESEVYHELLESQVFVKEWTSLQEVSIADQALNEILNKVFLITKKHEALQKNQHYMDLQRSLESLEEEILMKRLLYNSQVDTFSTALTSFPGKIYTGMFYFSEPHRFEVV